MDIDIAPGKYVLAVSGGVDSVVLLHLLSSKPGLKITVAHFDHGIRPDSRKDRLLVKSLASKYGLPFVYDEGNLGPDASEAMAREARYAFLRKVQRASRAKAIVTAHHQDDLLETAILNLIRGTGRKGLIALSSKPDLLRPLLQVRKQEIYEYAKHHALEWNEDSTNQDTSYLRNHIRHQVMPKFEEHHRAKLASLLEQAVVINQEIDKLLDGHLDLRSKAGQLDRWWFIGLPHTVALEIMAAWLRAQGVSDFDRKTLERLVASSKTTEPGKRIDVVRGHALEIGKQYLTLGTP